MVRTMKKQQRWISKSIVGLLCFIFFLSGCFSRSFQEDYDRAQSLVREEKYEEALVLYEKVFLNSSDEKLVYKSAKSAAELYEYRIKNFARAVHYLKFVIANSGNFNDSYESLRKKAFLEHRFLYHFEEAIQSYQRLLSYSDLPINESANIRLAIAKCYYAIHDYTSARTELKALMSPSQEEEIRFKAKILEASIYQTENKLDDAIKSYQEAMTININEKEKKEALISLALCFEQKESYKNALETMKKIPNQDEFLKMKVAQLERLVQFQGRRLQR